MSAQIRQERKTYYDLLERTQKGDLDITPWLEWFLACLDRAFDGAEATLGTVLRKAHFWETHGGEAFNDRQQIGRASCRERVCPCVESSVVAGSLKKKQKTEALK